MLFHIEYVCMDSEDDGIQCHITLSTSNTITITTSDTTYNDYMQGNNNYSSNGRRGFFKYNRNYNTFTDRIF